MYLQENTKLVGRYLIKQVLGHSYINFAEDYINYLGVDRLYGKKVVIKELYPSYGYRSSKDGDEITFRSERIDYDEEKEKILKRAQMTARLSKAKCIVKTTDFFEANNTVYVVTDYIEGLTLKKFLKLRRIEPEMFINIFTPLLESLDEMHRQGIIHCNISPDNIVLLSNGEVKLKGFRGEKTYIHEDAALTATDVIYRPLENYETHGMMGPWSDIYSLCATVYRCITGKTPPDVLQRIQEQSSLKKISDLGIPISPQLETAIMKGMSISVEERYHSIQELCEDLYKGY